MLRRRTDQLVSNEAGVRLGDDPEAVHQARVRYATPAVRPEVAPPRPRSRRDATGQTRAQVARRTARRRPRQPGAAIQARDRRRPVGARRRGGPGRAGPCRRRAVRGAAVSLLSAMSGDRYRLLLDDLWARSEHPPFRDDAPVGDHALPVVRRGAWRSWKQVRRAVDQLGDNRPTWSCTSCARRSSTPVTTRRPPSPSAPSRGRPPAGWECSRISWVSSRTRSSPWRGCRPR